MCGIFANITTNDDDGSRETERVYNGDYLLRIHDLPSSKCIIALQWSHNECHLLVASSLSLSLLLLLSSFYDQHPFYITFTQTSIAVKA